MLKFSHQMLGKPECPYVNRWMVDMGKYGSLRLHHWFGSDDQRAYHDHPWWFLTLVLKGGYQDLHPQAVLRCSQCHSTDITWNHLCTHCGWVDLEEAEAQAQDHLTAGSWRFRPAEHKHTVLVDKGGAWTVLLTGPEQRIWGFWVNGKFRKRNKYFFEHGHHPCENYDSSNLK
jgi:hypothetical protein